MHTVCYMCSSTLTHMHTHTLISAIPATQTNICYFSDECISTCDLCSSFSTWFFLYASALFRDYNITTNIYTFIVSSCSSEGASAVLLFPVTLEAHRRVACEALKRADSSPFLRVCTSFPSWKVCFTFFRVGLSELLLWWWSLWLDQGQRRRPALGDDAWSVR